MEEKKKGWSADTINELVQDWMCFEFILEIKRRMQDVEAKNYVSMFLKDLAPVITYEVAMALEIMGIQKKEVFFNQGMNKRVRDEREKFLKKRIVKSSTAKEIIDVMGLDFENKAYDMNILLKDGKLVDMNYETFNENITDNFEFWDSLFGMPKVMLNTMIKSLNNTDVTIDDLYSVLDVQINRIVEKVEKALKIKRYSYSVYKLFSKSSKLEIQDKIFILYRYRLVTSIDKLEKILPNINVEYKNRKICDIKSFFRKYRAVVINVIGEELKYFNSYFAQSMQNDIEMLITDKSFWSLNRKLRNNIHYVETETLTEEEISIVDMYQHVYMDIIEKHVKEHIYIEIDEECKTMTGFLKECMDKKISDEELHRNYEKYYLKHYYTGSLD